jgi:Flp pilus assembly protein TadG
MVSKLNRIERGQNLLIFAVLMIILIALAGLVIDGGYSLSKRREAQNAADAGALAGANALCAGNTSLARTQALDYAINRNGATAADVTMSTRVITVTTTIPHDTFLAGIFGTDVVTTTATASAGCYAPCSSASVMPVAWACHPPVGGSPDPNCTIQYGTMDEPGPKYIIMDSNKAVLDYACISSGGSLNCDIDGDGEDEYITGGGRSWLDLNAGGHGSSDLVDWITGAKAETIFTHMWLPATDGTSTDIYHAAEQRRINNPLVIVPVFNDYTVQCRPDIIGSCSSHWHSGLDQIRAYTSGSADYYHIISFSLFKITCVSSNQGQKCDGKQFLVDNNVIDKKVKTIEGYFIEGYVPGLSGKCNNNAGAYTIYLNH